MTITTDGNVGIGGNALISKLRVEGTIFAMGGVSSSRAFKYNIAKLPLNEAMKTLEALDPVTFRYKSDENKDLQVGFIAEDVPELVSTPERKGIIPMDIVAVLTKVVQAQQKSISALEERIKILEKSGEHKATYANRPDR